MFTLTGGVGGSGTGGGVQGPVRTNTASQGGTATINATARTSGTFVDTDGSTKNKWVQLFYVNKVLSLNSISIIKRIIINMSYILSGVYNYYIK